MFADSVTVTITGHFDALGNYEIIAYQIPLSGAQYF